VNETQDRYSQRRSRFAAILAEDSGGRPSVALLLAGEEHGLKKFEPDPNFFYLTGVEVSRAALLITAGQPKPADILLLPPSDPAKERWTGRALTAGGLTPSAQPDPERLESSRLTGHPNIGAYHELDEVLLRPLKDAEFLYVDCPEEALLAPLGASQLLAQRIRTHYPHLQVRHVGRLVAELRRVKDDHELALMRRAMEITAKAHAAILGHLRPGQFEYEIQALVEYVFTASGAQSAAFPSIIGSGPYSCTLHYERNRRQMQPGDLVVCDIGCRKDYYCADVTRTYPVSGRFTPRQREVYEVVLGAHRAAVKAAKPGAYVRDVHAAALDHIARAGYAPYFFHGTSHYLGIEAHDPGSYQKPLEPGVVITIEPGIYIAAENLGIRIENDLLITETGSAIMTDIPMDVPDIEGLLQAPRGGFPL
jgi:Xaa-Pro aminopeptidase